MTVQDIILLAINKGASFHLKEGKLALKAKKNTLPESLMDQIKDHKEEIIDYLKSLELSTPSKATLPPIKTASHGRPLLLSFAQQRLWFIDQLERGSLQYNVIEHFAWDGPVNLTALERALRSLIERHQILRTTIAVENESQVQVVNDTYRLPLTIHDFSAFAPDDLQNLVDQVAEKERTTLFNLREDLNLRVNCITLPGNMVLILYAIHHIASDGWSMRILRDELTALYSAYCSGHERPLEPLKAQYGDYAVWQRDWLTGEVLEQQLAFWKEELTGAPVVHRLPLDRERPVKVSYKGRAYRQFFDKNLTQEIKAQCAKHGVTLFMFAQTMFSVLLSRYSGEADVVMGTPIAGRTHKDVEPLIGFFVNSLVLRTRVSSELSFSELLEQNKQHILDVFSHQHMPFDMLVEKISPQRALNHNPMFQIVFAVQNTEKSVHAHEGGEKDKTSASPKGFYDNDARFDLELHVREDSGELVMTWILNSALFDDVSIQRMARNYETLARQVTLSLRTPEQKLAAADLAVLSEDELLLLTKEWCEHRFEFPMCTAIRNTLESLSGAGYNVEARALSSGSIYILDSNKNLLPIGATGEVHIACEETAVAKLNEVGQLGRKVVANPFSHGADKFLFKTGDFARWSAKGEIQFASDSAEVRAHASARGLRSTQNRLSRHPLLSDVIVRKVIAADRESSVICYFSRSKSLSSEASSLSLIAELRNYIRAGSDLLVIPEHFFELDKLPRTSKGDVETGALPVVAVKDAEAYTSPTNDVERKLCEIWRILFKNDRIGITDNFFDLGGHSLLATRLVSAVREAFNVEMPLHVLFESPTIAAMALSLAVETDEFVLPAITLAERAGTLPLSYAQRRLWLIDQLGRGSVQYNMAGKNHMLGEFDVEAFKRALETLIERHEILRTTYHSHEEHPIQVIQQDVVLPFSYEDLSELEPGLKVETAQELAELEANAPFNLAEDLMLRVRVLKLDHNSHFILYTMHHIASDGWSMGIFSNELSALYSAYKNTNPNPLPPLKFQYADYAMWQKSWLNGEVLGKQLTFWKNQLKGIPALHGLPIDRARPARRTFEGRQLSVHFERALSEQLYRLSDQHEVTLFMFLETALALLIGRYSNQSDVVIGTPMAGRIHKDIEDLIGFFINPVAMRTQLSSGHSFSDLLSENKKQILNAFANQHIPFEVLVDETDCESSPSYNPIFQIAFSVNKTDHASSSQAVTNGVKKRNVRFDLEIQIEDAGGSISVQWVYNVALFDDATIQRMSSSLEVLLASIVDDLTNGWNTDIYRLNLLNPRDKVIQLKDWNNTHKSLPDVRYVHRLFEYWAKRTHDALAVTFGDMSVSYQQLNERANKLAHHLRQIGVGPEVATAICVERSIEMVVAVLAVLKSGGCFLPIDPTLPSKRIKYILNNANCFNVITNSSTLAMHSMLADFDLVTLDSDLTIAAISEQSHSNIDPKVIGLRANNLAYMIFTSGSTGLPKGVMIQHQSWLNLSLCQAELFSVDHKSRGLQFASLSFDAAAWEFSMMLTHGASLHLLTEEQQRDPLALSALVKKHQLTHATLPPLLLKNLPMAAMESVTHLVVAGEAISADDAEIWRKDRHLFNAYGPTETTVCATAGELDGDQITIGEALPNYSAYVLDANLAPQPIGVVGELYVGGLGLARGYANNPAMTAERFVPHLFSDCAGERLYRTGDLVRRLHDGRLVFAGRKDAQVKLRGYRIELGEIESHIHASPLVKECAVVVRKDNAQSDQLVAYVVESEPYLSKVAANSDSINAWGGERRETSFVAELQADLASLLPHYMVPSIFVVLPVLPVTSTGKVDRHGLPEPTEQDFARKTFAAPRNDTEKELSRLWQEILRVEQVGINDNFFSLGGNSLLAMRLASAVRSSFDVEFPLYMLFESPTVEAMSEYITRSASQAAMPAIERAERHDMMPLSYGQERLWFIDQLEQGSPQYNMLSHDVFDGEFKDDCFKKTLYEIVNRHEVLRTNYVSLPGGSAQVVRAEFELRIDRHDIGGLPQGEAEAFLKELFAREAVTPFDLKNDPMLRVSVVKMESARHLVLFSIHHIASDAWSISIFKRELTTLYSAFCLNEQSPLAPLACQYSDYIHWQRAWLKGALLDKHLDYWRSYLAGVPTMHSLAMDMPRPKRQSYQGKRFKQVLDSATAAKLTELCGRCEVTLFMMLQSIFSILLARYSNETDIVTGTSVAGRVHKDTEGMIGFFVNSLVIRADLSENSRFVEFLAKNKHDILMGQEHQYLPFEMLVEELQPNRNIAHNPIFQIFFGMQNVDDIGGAPLTANDDTAAEGATPPVVSRSITQFDLELNVKETANGIALAWGFNSTLFYDETVLLMAEHYCVLIENLLAAASSQSIDSLRVFDIPLLTEVAMHRQLSHAEAGSMKPAHDQYVHERFETNASLRSDAVAAVYDGIVISYGQLNERANKVAHWLLDQKVEPNTVIGLYIERSTEMLVGVLGILKAGCSYLPLDHNWSESRLSWMIADAEVGIVLTQSELLGNLTSEALKLLPLEESFLQRLLKNYPTRNVTRFENRLSPANLAYIIYTSGSTGKPKGVAVTHSGLNNYIEHACQYFDDICDGAVLSSTLAFDATVTSLLTPLCRNKRIEVLADDKQLMENLAKRINSASSYVFKITPAHLQGLLDAGLIQNDHDKSHTFVIGGEKLIQALVSEWKRILPCSIYINEYGPTESTVGCSTFEACGEQTELPQGFGVPIGRPIKNVSLYVLDKNLRIQPPGVPGELYIGGASLAQGYLNRPDLTAEKFVPNPFSNLSGERLYKTGDIVRLMHNGQLDFIGRIDDQIKIRGYRIELGEIEANLSQHSAVKACVATVIDLSQGDQRLVAYVVPETGHEAKEWSDFQSELHEMARAQLPDYMVPSAIIHIAHIPLTLNGKVDKAALPKPSDLVVSSKPFVAPRGRTETELCRLWEAHLRIQRVGIDDNFFTLGGHSLLAMKLISAIRGSLGTELPLAVIFDASTVRELGSYIENQCQSPLLPVIKKVSRDQLLPLSYAQQRLWFIDKLGGGSPQYNIPGQVRIEGRFDTNAFRAAVTRLIERHETLRTSYVEQQGQPYQHILHNWEAPIEFHHFEQSAEVETGSFVNELMRQQLSEPFDLSTDLAIRFVVVHLSVDQHLVLYTMHHIATDGWSMRILRDELLALYWSFERNEKIELGRVDTQYADYAVWQREWLSGDALAGQINYWKQQLAGIPEKHALPLDKQRPMVQSFEGKVCQQVLDAAMTNSLKRACELHGVTLFMLLQTAYALLLSRYSQQKDVVMGVPIAGRTHGELEGMVGFFVNALVLRTRITSDQTFAELLRENKKVILDAYHNQHVPFEMLVEEVSKERSMAYNPLFQVTFAFQNKDESGSAGAVNATSTSYEKVPLTFSKITTKFDLELHAGEHEDHLSLKWVFNDRLFDESTIASIAGNFVQMLDSALKSLALLGSETCDVGRLELLTARERAKLVHEWNDTGRAFDREVCLHSLFVERAKASPESIALMMDECVMSYADLDNRSSQLARHLQSLGTQSDEVVGIFLSDKFDTVVAIYAVLKAGAAYLPIDVNYPSGRIEYMLSDSQVRTVLTSSDIVFSGGDRQLQCVEMDKIAKVPAYASSGEGYECRAKPDNLAYVIYTSGSTGRPKGVMIEHRNVVNLMSYLAKTATSVPGSRTSLWASLSFDASVYELFNALSSGCCVVFPSEQVRCDALPLFEWMQRNQINNAYIPPFFVNEFAEWLEQGNNVPLHNILVGVEPILEGALQSIAASVHGVRILNGYGPTEITVCSTMYPVVDKNERQNRRRTPIGKPIDNAVHYVLDNDMQLLPIGAVGELYIGGAGVSRGYINNPALTSEKFKDNPYDTRVHTRLYRTGDLVRYHRDGNLEFVGRVDDQVKINGLRIELSEIQHQLSLHESVENSVVLVIERQSGHHFIVAYVVLSGIGNRRQQGSSTDLKEILTEHLRQTLPAYMLPSAIVSIDTLPLTINGKVDKEMLPEVDVQLLTSSDYVAPQNADEARMVKIWSELLAVEQGQLSTNANFFTVGGHSLLATRLVSVIRNEFNVEVPLTAVFEAPSIKTLCTRLQSCRSNIVIQPIKPVDRTKPLALSFAQQRLWFIDQLSGGSPEYNMPGQWVLHGSLNMTAFQCAYKAILERHEVLRTVYVVMDGQPVQVVKDRFELCLQLHDLTDVDTAGKAQEIQRLSKSEVHSVFDLSKDLMLRFRILKLDGETNLVLYTMHHIASDGWSIEIFAKEFELLYAACNKGAPSTLTPLRVQYADFAQWQRTWLSGALLEQQSAYWKHHLADIPSVHNLPLDKKRPATQGMSGKGFRQRLGSGLTQKMEALSAEHDVTLFMLLQTAFAVLLARHCDQRDIVMGSPIAGRTHSDVEGLIGFFVNTLVLRTDVSGNPSFAELLQRNKTVILNAYANQHIPFEMLVGELNAQRSLSHNPVFQILFGLQNHSAVAVGGEPEEESSSNSLSVFETVTQFDIEVSISKTNKGLSASWVFNSSIFEEQTVLNLAVRYHALLDSIVDSLANPEHRPKGVEDLRLLIESDERQQLVEWSRFSGRGSDSSVIDLIEEQVRCHPDAIALVDNDRKMSYRTLDQQANRLAKLLKKKEVKPGDIVGVCAERGCDQIVSVLAIFKVGAAYLPLDPRYPQSRIDYMVRDTDVQIVLCQERTLSCLSSPERGELLAIDSVSVRQAIQQLPAVDVERPARSAGNVLAYVMYTSGSTGLPKGAMVTQGNLVSYCLAASETYNLRHEDNILQLSSFSFDIFVEETFGALVSGATLVFRNEELMEGGRKFLDFVRNNGISVMSSPTAFWNALVSSVDEPVGDLPLRLMIVGGERMPVSSLKQWQRCFGSSVKLLNTYGPTEATVIATCFDATNYRAGDREIPIGRALPNAKLYVLDNKLNLLPTGSVGELHIGGDGVAMGYLGKSHLTEQVFLNDPFDPSGNARMYKTGDLVRYLPSGELEFVGRKDQQIKIRGFRVELGEIESVLSGMHCIKASVVRAVEIEGVQRLIAYIVLDNASAQAAGQVQAENLNAIRQVLKQTLPEYMVPHALVEIDAIPMTANGKVDASSLPVPHDMAKGNRVDVPKNEAESTIINIWAEVLRLPSEQISVSDNFFEIGGHSLALIRVTARINKAFKTRIPMASFYQRQTVLAVAELVVATIGGAPHIDATSEPISMLRHGQVDEAPLYFVPPLGGDIACYMSLLNRLSYSGDVLGFRALDGTNGSSKPADLKELAQHYAEQILRCQLHKAVRLAGWSFGGVVAIEIARVLRGNGINVEHLVVMDSYNPEVIASLQRQSHKSLKQKQRDLIVNFATELGIDRDQLLAVDVDTSAEMMLFTIRELGIAQGTLLQDVSLDELNARWTVMKELDVLFETHRPDTYAEPVLLIQARNQGDIKASDTWGDSLPGMSVEELPGDHFSILQKPVVDLLAERLNKVFSRAE